MTHEKLLHLLHFFNENKTEVEQENQLKVRKFVIIAPSNYAKILVSYLSTYLLNEPSKRVKSTAYARRDNLIHQDRRFLLYKETSFVRVSLYKVIW